MFGWIGKGLRTGIVTTRYPYAAPEFQTLTVPTIDWKQLRPESCLLLATVCPTGALSTDDTGTALRLNYGRCISCGFCAGALPNVARMTDEIELAARDRADLTITYQLTRG